MRESALGLPMKFLGGAMLVGNAVLAAFALSDALVWWQKLLAFLGGSLLGVVGSAIFSLGRRLTAVGGLDVLLRDRRAPVIYLRSFERDAITVDPDLFGLSAGAPEDSLRKAVAQLGPGVAVGRPDEPLPALGFPRIYVDDENWQAIVLEFLQKSRLIILEYGRSAGLSWELDAVLHRVDRRRLLLRFSENALWEEFRSRWTDPAHPLPEAKNVRMLGFRPDGSPTILFTADQYSPDRALKAYFSELPTADPPVWSWRS